ncbi:MAG: hypothetical protein M0R73_07725 [Dehalococcoidia bacterium]|nr:hypothetical protein [Dehalococcoidia bacterium]
MAVLALAALFLAACAPSDPPPRSPFGEDDATSAATTGTPRPLPTFPATAAPTADGQPSDGGAATPPPADAQAEEARRERVVGEAISRMAEWTGVPETEIRPAQDTVAEPVEEVAWPSACLGVVSPTVTCAEVQTPGYRIALELSLDRDRPQFVHASRTGAYRWWGEFEATREVETVDLQGGVVTFTSVVPPDSPGADDIVGRRHRVLPGTDLAVPLADLEPGDRVRFASGYPLPGDDAGALTWLVRMQ